MILKQTIVQQIVSGINGIDHDIAKELGFTQQWVRSLSKKNKPNGPLTTLAALEVIRKITGLEDNEICEEAMETVKTNI